MKDNNEKLKEMLTSEQIPEQLSPGNIKKMLDEKAPKKKRSGISVAGRIAAGAAACAVIAGSYAGTAHLMKARKNGNASLPSGTVSQEGNTKKDRIYVEAPYMNGAKNYEDVYEIMESSAKKYDKEQKRRKSFSFGNKYKTESFVESAIPAEESVMDGEATYGNSELSVNEENNSTPEYSETYNQEDGVLEADIVKTDGKNIYYIWNNGNMDYYVDDNGYYVNSSYRDYPVLDIASVKDGEFTGSSTLDLTPDLSSFDLEGKYNVQVYDMYIYNDMIEVIGTVNSGAYYYGKYVDGNGYYIDDKGNYHDPVSSTFVSVYTTDDKPELIGTYFQDGIYNDVRITPDGCMYLVSNYSTVDFKSVESSKNVERYIPCCGTENEIECMPPEDILLPTDYSESRYMMNYTVISGIDFSEQGEFSVVDSKALAGFTGTIYSSVDNIYAVVRDGDDSDVTRIAVQGGTIEPMASGSVEGYVLNQFSMSEYNGYFRIATTINKYHDNSTIIGGIFGTDEPSFTERNNAVTVLDMDMNTVGKIKDFGINESIKSVSFSGDMGYVVTYRQTDPLFAIDLSEPTDPTIIDEFKINGFSTYMQKWDDGLLLGFGIDANDAGVQTGVKLVMFDNSDPSDLREVGFCALNTYTTDSSYVYSMATYERKALLIAPEKNLIGFPVQIYDRDSYESTYKYVFYSYEDGEFVFRGEIKDGNMAERYSSADRALYIGNYVYVLSGEKFVSADMDTMSIVDTLEFN